MTIQVNEQVAALAKAQWESALKLAEVTAQGLDKFAAVQFNAVKTAFADSIETTKQLASIKDPSEFAAVATTWTQPAWEKAQAYARSVYDVAATTHAEVTAVIEQQVGEFNKNVVVALDTVLKNAPAGSEGAVTAVKSAIQSAGAAYETVLKATKRVTTMAQNNAAGIVAQTTPMRKKAA